MIDQRFVFLAAIIDLAGVSTYIYSTLKGETKPNRVTWLLWAIIPLIAFAAEKNEHVGLPAVMTFMVGFCPLLVFLSSFFNGKAYWKISRLDIACGALSVLALIVWRLIGTGNVAIAFSLIADSLAGAPTLGKSLVAPSTENGKIFLCGAANATITLLTINDWNFANWGYPLYILVFCLVLFFVIEFRLGKKLERFVPAFLVNASAEQE